MRRIGLILLALFAAGSTACWINDPRPDRSVHGESGWVRTADGWEHSGSWSHRSEPYQPAPHPAVVGLGILLLSLLVLVGFSPDDTAGPPPRSGRRQAGSRRRAGDRSAGRTRDRRPAR